LGKYILNTAIPGRFTNWAGAVAPRIYFYFHICIIAKKQLYEKVCFNTQTWKNNYEFSVFMIYWSESMNLAGLIDKVIEFLNKIKGLVLACWARVLTMLKLFARIPANRTRGPVKAPGKKNPFMESRFGSFTDWFRRSFGPGSVPEGKRRVMLFGIGGFSALFLILIIAILALNIGRPKESSARDLSGGPVIMSEDLFIPAEPDFIPQFLPEREPRRSWTLDDIRPYWRSPGDPDLWAGEIKSEVDKLMEGVP